MQSGPRVRVGANLRLGVAEEFIVGSRPVLIPRVRIQVRFQDLKSI